MSSKYLFIELNELNLFAVFDYSSRHCCGCAKFKTKFVLIHLIRASKDEVIFLHFNANHFKNIMMYFCKSR